MQKEFSYEERLNAVLLHIEQKEKICDIAKQVGTSETIIQRWIRLYNSHSAEGLKSKPNKIRYTESFKEMVRDDFKKNKLSILQTAIKYQLSDSTIARWCVQYSGGNKMSKNYSFIDSEEAAEIRKRYKNTKDPELKKILERNEYLEMENVILKKLRALTEQQENEK